MSRTNLRYEIGEVGYLKEMFVKFEKRANDIINKLKEVFDENELHVSEIIDNSFEFTFWGLNFITKSEISFDSEYKNFTKGELTTFLKHEETLDPIVTYGFDNIGNIGNGCLLSDFADYYYVQFVKNLISLSNEKNIKFQLK